jgi:uncharacterized membrane protein YsdA (DUF1294 family)
MTEQDRIALDEEAHDLGIHVKMCAIRHAQILSRIDQADADAKAWRGRVEKGIWALVVMVGGGLGAGVTQVMPVVRAMADQ